MSFLIGKAHGVGDGRRRRHIQSAAEERAGERYVAQRPIQALAGLLRATGLVINQHLLDVVLPVADRPRAGAFLPYLRRGAGTVLAEGNNHLIGANPHSVVHVQALNMPGIEAWNERVYIQVRGRSRVGADDVALPFLRTGGFFVDVNGCSLRIGDFVLHGRIATIQGVTKIIRRCSDSLCALCYSCSASPFWNAIWGYGIARVTDGGVGVVGVAVPTADVKVAIPKLQDAFFIRQVKVETPIACVN
ncbi:MAG: hypothetical protein BWY63_03195 [Chloroflexi bacterium ADurb.Bin360]|nr:MAG: hypothetical protein BWY63_03195 [Chloroflexi bacterium ADurb.Bin360]